MSRTQQQSLQQNQQSRYDGRLVNPLGQPNIPSTAHSCENPFRFASRNFQDFGESFDEKVEVGNRNQMSSSDEDSINQRKYLLQKLKKLESRKQQNNDIYKTDNSWSTEITSVGNLKQGSIPTNQKGSCFTFSDETCSQKVLTEQSIAAPFQLQPTQLQSQNIQSSNNQNISAGSTTQMLKAEIKALRKELENSENSNMKLKLELKDKIQQIEDLQKEFEKVNSQFQQQALVLKGSRDSGSRSKDTLRNSQNSNAMQEQKKFIDELISTNYLKDNQINHLKRELKNSYLTIGKQKEEIQKLTLALNSHSVNNNFKKSEENNQDMAEQLKQLKTIQTTYQTIAYTEPDMRNEEMSYVKESDYIEHIQRLQKKIDILSDQRSNKINFESQEIEDFKTKTNRDRGQMALNNGEQIKSTLKKQAQVTHDQLPTSKSQITKETIDKKNINFDRKDSEYQLNLKTINSKTDYVNNNIPEPSNFGQFSLLESDLFNNPQKVKEFGMNNLIEMESFNLSPIKNKSYKQEKSTICDKSCLQAILTIDDLSHRGLRLNANAQNAQNSVEQNKEYENLQEELELNQNNFQNRIKKVLDMNAIQLGDQQTNEQEFKLKEENCPDFQEFVTQLHQTNIQNVYQNLPSRPINSEEGNQYDPENKLINSSSNQNNRYDDYQQYQKMITQSSSQKQCLAEAVTTTNRYQGKEQKQCQNQGLQKSQSHSLQAVHQTEDRQRKKNEDSQQRIHSVDNDKTKYSKLSIGIPNVIQNPQSQQSQLQKQQTPKSQLNAQQQSELHYSMYYNNKTKSEAVLNSHQKIGNTHQKERCQTNGGQIIQQVPHTTKETSKRFIFDSSDCSLQFKEDIDDFRRILDGNRRSSLNKEQINANKQDYCPTQEVYLNPNQSNSGQNIVSKRSLNSQYMATSNNNNKNEQKYSSQSLEASSRTQQNAQNQPISSKKKISESNNLKYYENNNQQQNNFDSQVRNSTGSISQSQNQNQMRSNRISSITDSDNKHYFGNIASNKKATCANTNNSCNVGNKNKIDSIQNNNLTLDNKIIQSHNGNPFIISTPKSSQEQTSSTSKKKLGNLANGNSYHLQQKHHDKYDFYYQNNTHTAMMMNQNSNDDQQNLKNNYQFYNNKNSTTPYVNNNTVAPSHSSGDLVSQNKILLSNKQKKVTGMIVNTATSREFECVPTTTSNLLRKQIASTVNEAVRNSTQHLQIIYNSNNLASNQSNQQLSQQQQTTRQGENHSIDSCSSRKQEKNYISQSNNDTNIAQQNYHGLQNILNYHVNKQHENGLNSRYVSSHVERLREVKNRVRDLNLNNESNQSQSLHLNSKENYPPSTSSINIINSIFQTNTGHNDHLNIHSKNNSNKGGEKNLDNANACSRRSSQNNQFSTGNNKSGGQFASNNVLKSETDYSTDRLTNLLKDSNKRNLNVAKNEDQHAIKRNSSYNSQQSKQSSQIPYESNNTRKSDSAKRSVKQ